MKKRIISIITTIMMALTIVSAPMPVLANTSNVDSDDIKYQVTDGYIYFDEATGTITGCDTSVTKVVIPETIGGVPVEGIGDSAFHSCSYLTEVNIPNSVKSIGICAFYHCGSLETIHIPDSVTAIDVGAFDNCFSLTSINVDIDNRYYLSEDGVLFSKSKATLIKCPEGNSRESYVIPDGVETIGVDAFYGCTSLTEIELPDSVVNIASYAFAHCDSLTKINIPNGVTNINENTFFYCSDLVSVNIPNSVVTIGDSAFHWCKSITTVNIPNSVTNIGESAFSSCHSLTGMNIPDSVTSIADNTFADTSNLTIYGSEGSYAQTYAEDHNIYFVVGGIYPVSGGYIYFNGETGLITRCDDSVTEADIPAQINGVDVTGIQDYAFEYCEVLTRVSFPNSLKTIGDSAFYQCISLEKVEMGEGVTDIGTEAFSCCFSLETIDLPDSVTMIDTGAFWLCSSLTAIEIPSGVINIGDGAFSRCSSLTSITVDTGNPYFSSENGVLFNKAKTVLKQYPVGNKIQSYSIPSSVVAIDAYAFRDAGYITAIHIPDSVVSIGDDAFSECSSLVIYGEGGSYAQTYADIYGIPFSLAVKEESAQKYSQTITGSTSFSKTFGSKPFNLGASAKTPLTYKSSNTKIAVVSSDGKVILKNPGKATITITAAETEQYKGTSKIVTINVKLKTPTLKAKTSGKRKVKLSWGKVPGATKYEVYMYDAKKKKFVKKITKKASKRTALHKGMTKGKTYKYKVRAYRVVDGKKVYSAFSKVKKVKAK